jgi:hypothetical protein
MDTASETMPDVIRDLIGSFISRALDASDKLDIIIWIGPASEHWSPRHIDEQGLGGRSLLGEQLR